MKRTRWSGVQWSHQDASSLNESKETSDWQKPPALNQSWSKEHFGFLQATKIVTSFSEHAELQEAKLWRGDLQFFAEAMVKYYNPSWTIGQARSMLWKMKFHVKVIQSCNSHKGLRNESIMTDTTLQTKVFTTRPRKEHYPTEDKLWVENAITPDNMPRI